MHVAKISFDVSLIMSLRSKCEKAMHITVQSASVVNLLCGAVFCILASGLLLEPAFIIWISVFTLFTFDSTWLVLKVHGDSIAYGLLLVGALMIILSRVTSTASQRSTKLMFLTQFGAAVAVVIGFQHLRNLLYKARRKLGFTSPFSLAMSDQYVLNEIDRLVLTMYKLCDPFDVEVFTHMEGYFVSCKNTQLCWFSDFMETCDVGKISATSVHSPIVSGCGLKVMEKLELNSVLVMSWLRMLGCVTMVWTLLSCFMVLYRIAQRSSYHEITNPMSRSKALSASKHFPPNGKTCHIVMSGDHNVRCTSHQYMNVFQAIPIAYILDDNAPLQLI